MVMASGLHLDTRIARSMLHTGSPVPHPCGRHNLAHTYLHSLTSLFPAIFPYCLPSFPNEIIGFSGGYHPEDMNQHKNYIARDTKQRQVQHSALPEDYPILLPEVVVPAKPARDGQGQQLCLLQGDLAERADQIVKVSFAKKIPSAIPTKGAAKSMVDRDPQGTEVTVEAGPTVYAPTLSLSDAPNKEGRPYPCGACLSTPLWCLQTSIIRGLSA